MIYKSIAGAISVVLWILVFLPALIISSAPYRQQLENGVFTTKTIFMTLITYTVTNVAILCCLAGVIGASTRMIIDAAKHKGQKQKDSFNFAGIMLAGVMRSFLIYLLFISGIYLATNAPFANPTQEQYVRVAGMISLFAFVAGYEPKFFGRIMESFSTSTLKSGR